MPTLAELMRRLAPSLAPVSRTERLRATFGALLGVAITGFASAALVGGEAAHLPLLIAPMGASAVLLFAVPSSPLAQPWSLIGGNLVAAIIGVTAAKFVPDVFLAAAVGVSGAIAAMLALRCVHPPSGAVALTAVVGGPAISQLGYEFVFWPVLANSVLLLASAVAYNNLTGRAYPHRAPAISAAPRENEPPQSARLGFSSEDIDAALAEHDELLDVDRGDLEMILRRAEVRALRRRSGELTCGDVMTRDVIGVSPETPLLEALDIVRRHHVKALPVTDGNARVIGILTQTDLLDKVAWGPKGPRLSLTQRLHLRALNGTAPNSVVREVMTSPAKTSTPDAPIADLVRLMTTAGLHHLPVVDRHSQLIGIVTQTDLIAALLLSRTPRPDRAAA
ncbi:HPP family protein [Hansschlegelia sp.]|uniref:HPP family protein n=1 Tax=Hansschlegelia sp. TaxID=2041892 RepID=UPI002B918910|nr:HPP family protein [Hansschlegelia sp.]HVI29951.1 HPP family protein [Hansschlegelia sp.]